MATKRKIYIKCPYCDNKFVKEDLVSHIEDNHDDMIPENYSAFRVVFDYINNKPAGYNGKCVICGKESGWNEDKGRYNRICNNPNCKSTYIKQFESSMNDKYGYSRISSTEEGQEKMLSSRKISGVYKFKDGIEKSYVGSYEKNALEFMDKVLHIKSEDIFTPGPTFKYLYNTSEHLYISDMYYQPYNLLIEVKDGGNNPNKRNMKEYREKQLAKEEYIIKNTNYNYIRLTNNDFSQLLAVFMDLKMSMVETSGKDRVIHVNEASEDKSKYDSNFIKKDQVKYKAIDIYNNECYEYFDKNEIDHYRNHGKVGEILVETEYKSAIGYIYVSPDHKYYRYKGNVIGPFKVFDYYKGMGLGKVLLKDAMNKYKANLLGVYKDNEVAYNLYKNCGFTILEESTYRNETFIIMGYNINKNSISEAMNALTSGFMPGIYSPNSSYIVNYMQNNAFHQGYSHDIKLHNLIIRDDKDSTLKKISDNDFVDSLKIESVYRVNKNPEDMYSIFNKYIGKNVSEHFIYETVFNHKYYDDNQIKLEDVELVLDFNSELSLLESNIKEYILNKEDILDSVNKELNIIGGEIHGC